MYELKIVAATIPELLAKAAELAALGVTVTGSPEVPLPTPRRRKPKEEPEEAMHAAAPQEEEPESPQTDAPADETQPEAQSGSEPTTTAAEPVSSGASTSLAGTATSASPSEPHAPPGVVYLMKGDAYNKDKRRMTYMDGSRHSTVHKDNEGKYVEYAQHAPEKPAEAAQEPGDVPDVYNDDSGPRSVEEARLESLVEGVEPMQDEDVPEEPMVPLTEADEAVLGDDTAADPAMPAELAHYVESIETAATWADAKKIMREFYTSDVYKGFPEARKNNIRRATWDTCLERKSAGAMRDLPDQIDDVSAFRLWLEYVDDKDAINGTFYTLQRSDAWKEAPEPVKGMLSGAVRDRLAAL